MVTSAVRDVTVALERSSLTLDQADEPFDEDYQEDICDAFEDVWASISIFLFPLTTYY